MAHRSASGLVTVDALVPRLTAVDRRVLAALPHDGATGARIFDTFKAPSDTPRCPRHGRNYAAERIRGCPHCKRALDFIADRYDEHCEILRGLERTGYVTCRGGWWRRV